MKTQESKREPGAAFGAAHGSATGHNWEKLAKERGEGEAQARAENALLREWIRAEGVRTDTCTYEVLREICEGCRCKRYYSKHGYGQSPNDKVSDGGGQ